MQLKQKYLRGECLISEAEKAGLTVRRGKGDHVVVHAPKGKICDGRSYMVIPDRPLGKGLAAKVVKWMIAAGVPLSLILSLLMLAK